MASTRMQPEPLAGLLGRILHEREGSGSILDIPAGAFVVPPFPSSHFRVLSETCSLPVGPAAGPHTHLAGSILSGWLTGGRIFELKTVQILDELDIEKPCIDAADEGYNTEWSTELRIDEAIEEYTKASILLHLLSALEHGTPDHGAIFTMSVGYDHAGITAERVDRFIDTLCGRAPNPAFDRLRDEARLALSPASGGPAAPAVSRALEALETIEPVMCRSVALSTMHGCPPEEIEAIALHLLEEKGLDTVVKLNPTLLGLEEVGRILEENGYAYRLDPQDFARDLQYPRALELIARLRSRARAAGRRFGVKLSNTLPVANERGRLPGETEYVSGKALLPLTVSLAAKLTGDLPETLPVSYSAGATAGNIGELLGCGLAPVTISTELLKPGGYQRLAAATQAAARALSSGAAAGELTPDPAALAALAASVSGRHDLRARRGATTARVAGSLPVTDCFIAPCVEACPISQDVPGYIRAAATGTDEEALSCILETNPFPSLTAALCDQRCAKACTRIEYEGPVQIRKMKGIAVRRAGEAPPAGPARTPAHGEEPAVVAVQPGIEGMSAAYFHARAGRAVEVADSRQAVEERIAGELSGYRVPEGAIHADVERIAAAGVHFAGPARAPDTSAPDTSAPDTPATVIRQSAPQPRPRIVELIAAGRARVPDAPGGEAGSRRAAAAALHGEEIRLKAGRRIPPGRGSDGEVAAVELSRCLECAAVCLKCVQVCPNRANTAVEARPGDGLRDRYQVVHLDEWCNDCGNCETFCPYEAQPYREKLTVFASEGRLAASPAPGFFLAADEVLVRARFEGPVARIERARLDGGRAGGGSSGDGGSGDGNGGRGDAERPVFMLIRRILADYPYLIPGGA